MNTKFYHLRDDILVPGRWHLGEVVDSEGSEPLLDSCLPFAGDKALSLGVTHSGVALDFSLTSFGVPIAKDRLANVIQAKAGSDVQCISVLIKDKPEFSVVNVLRLVPCLDEERSQFIKWKHHDHRADLVGQHRQVTKLHVNSQMIPRNAHCFRIEGWLSGLIVSEAIKVAMEKDGCFGAVFEGVI